MVTIDCSYKAAVNSTSPLVGKHTEPRELEMNGSNTSTTNAATAAAAAAVVSLAASSGSDDVPLLVSDNDEYSDDESLYSQQGKSNIDNEKRDAKKASSGLSSTLEIDTTISNSVSNSDSGSSGVLIERKKIQIPLSKEQFLKERTQLMTIVVKYLATKIINSFPPESTKHTTMKELPLDKFLLVLTSRLNLSLNSFIQGMIYLFRYMDVVYLLRYLNQSNNFANYNEMKFSVKKLIIGCFKITLTNANIKKDWCGVTGLDKQEMDSIVDVLTTRMNGKLSIKQIEVTKMKFEIFRFIKMVSKTV